jgi:3',5'-cyclic-nucleotide phosphodiesterase
MLNPIGKLWITLALSAATLLVKAQDSPQIYFKVVPLGIRGGLDESNLSAYLVAAEGTTDFVGLDAGTIRAGLEKAIRQKTFQKDAETLLQENIKGYLLSHGHNDHIEGLVINSTNDTKKFIYGLPYVIDVLKSNYFSWKSWANFTNEGEAPTLGKYQYVTLPEGKDTSIANTRLRVQAFRLSHSKPYQSTAFLLQNNGHYLLYLGDTGADRIEKSDRLAQLWQAIGPLIKTHALKAIFIEVSYPNAQPENQLYGHLTPSLLMEELDKLSLVAGLAALREVKIVITHMKPAPKAVQTITRELTAHNPMQLQLVFPEQGSLMQF